MSSNEVDCYCFECFYSGYDFPSSLANTAFDTRDNTTISKEIKNKTRNKVRKASAKASPSSPEHFLNFLFCTPCENFICLRCVKKFGIKGLVYCDYCSLKYHVIPEFLIYFCDEKGSGHIPSINHLTNIMKFQNVFIQNGTSYCNVELFMRELLTFDSIESTTINNPK